MILIENKRVSTNIIRLIMPFTKHKFNHENSSIEAFNMKHHVTLPYTYARRIREQRMMRDTVLKKYRSIQGIIMTFFFICSFQMPGRSSAQNLWPAFSVQNYLLCIHFIFSHNRCRRYLVAIFWENCVNFCFLLGTLNTEHK